MAGLRPCYVVIVAEQLRGQPGRSEEVALLMALIVGSVVWRGVMLVHRNRCFVVH